MAEFEAYIAGFYCVIFGVFFLHELVDMYYEWFPYKPKRKVSPDEYEQYQK